MIEHISEKFYSLAGSIVPLSLVESETDVYPYAVYAHEPEYNYDKDGPYSITSGLECTIYGKDLDQIEELAAQVIDAVSGGMNDGTFSARLVRGGKNCVEGEWSVTMIFNVREFL